METCIYLKESLTTLNYRSREHVIPAGLGGIAKLPRGTVSDEANNIFSKREAVALRETILAINRRNNGPGKRGSQSVRNIKNPQIEVFEDTSNSESNASEKSYLPVKMGYFFYGEIYIIPQIYCKIGYDKSVQIPILSLGTLSEMQDEEVETFTSKLGLFLAQAGKTQANYLLVKTELEIKQEYIAIGSFQNKWYICSSLSELDLHSYLRLLEMKPIPSKMILMPETPKKYHYSINMTKAFSDELTFIYVKTAFNTLAYLKSPDFIRDMQFDELRESIVLGEHLDRRMMVDQLAPEWLSPWVMEKVPPKSHLVVLHGHGCYIDAYVSFYKEYVRNPIRLSENYVGEEFRLYFFCDFLAKEEKNGVIDL